MEPDHSDELLDDAAPNCPRCLHRLEPAGTVERPWWECAACGWTGVAV